MTAQENNKSAETKNKYSLSVTKDDLKKVSNFVWDRSSGKVLGRNGESWLKITVFYIVFYAALAGFWMFSYYIFDSLTITKDEPRWILDESLIRTNPGITIRPKPYWREDLSNIISYDPQNETEADIWFEKLEHYFNKTAEKTKQGVIVSNCSQENPASKTQSCKVDMDDFGEECTVANKFGYPDGTPCILLKLNRIYGWKPEPFGLNSKGEYEESILQKDFEEHLDIPEDLRKHIEEGVKTAENPSSFLNTVWFSCKGRSATHKENLGQIAYYPMQGIPSYYFPYYNQPGYQSPFIFVNLLNPKRGVIIEIECQPWSRNNKYDKYFRVGFVQFEVKIGDTVSSASSSISDETSATSEPPASPPPASVKLLPPL